MTLGEIFTGLGYLTGAVVCYWAARQKKLATEGMAKLAVIGFFGGIVGAKLTELIAEGWPVTVPWSAILDPRLGGRALFGGLVVGWLAVEIAKRRMGIKRSTGDLFALALPAGEAVGRIGCYYNQCCYGTECDLPWAVFQHGANRHPAQLYSSASALLIFIGLLAVRRRVAEGDLFKWYLLLFGVSRFLLEFVRFRPTLVLSLSPMQWFCIELAIGAGVSLILARKVRQRTQTDPPLG